MPLRLEDLPGRLQQMINTAPVVQGKVPTPDEIEAQKIFKAAVKNALETHTPDEDGAPISYNAIMKIVKEKRHAGMVKEEKEKVPIICKPKEDKPSPKPINSKKITLPTRDETGRSSNCCKHIDYLLVLDFEANCNDKEPIPEPQEIIEFPTLLLNVRTGELEDTFHHYIQPEVHTALTDFCTSLTGISQEMVDGGIKLDQALNLHRQWLEKHGLISASNMASATTRIPERQKFLYVTCGDWDLKTCLPQQLQYHNREVPYYFKSWINIQRDFSSLYHCRSRGMTNMLKLLEITLEGRHHSGIDDCRNLAKICNRMLDDGWVPKGTTLDGAQKILHSIPMAEYQLLVGVVGTSRRGLVDPELTKIAVTVALEKVESAAKEMDKQLVIVGRGGIVPKLAFGWGLEKGYQAFQVVSNAVKSTPHDVKRVTIGTNHGDESQAFVMFLDAMVRVGGGPQSLGEVEDFRTLHPGKLVIESDVPLLSEAAVSGKGK